VWSNDRVSATADIQHFQKRSFGNDRFHRHQIGADSHKLPFKPQFQFARQQDIDGPLVAISGKHRHSDGSGFQRQIGIDVDTDQAWVRRVGTC
jgi:hypothetical protein